MDNVSTKRQGLIFSGRPLASLTACYLLGTWLGLNIPVSLTRLIIAAATAWLAAAACCVALRMNVVINPRLRRVGAAVLAVSLGLIAALCAWSAAALDKTSRSTGSEIAGRIIDHTNSVEVAGVVGNDPEFRRVANERVACVFLFRVDELNGRRIPGAVPIRVKWYGWAKSRLPAYGERWQLAGTVETRSDAGFGGRRRQSVSFNTGQGRARLLSVGHGNRFLARCYAVRRAAADCLTRGIESRKAEVGLIHALLLGYRGRLPEEVRSVCMSTGTLHVFAISGLHVGILALLGVFVLQAMGVSRVHWGCWLAPLLIAYTCATGARASAVRACIMAIVFFMAPLLNRKADIFSSLAFAALVMVIADPAQLVDVGFIYSFTVMIGLVMLCPLLEKPMRRLWERDPFAAYDLEKKIRPFEIRLLRFVIRIRRSTVRSAWRRAIKYACGLVAVSISAWVVSAPLTALFFGRVTPIAIISNLVVIPAAFLVVFTGCLSLVAGLCFVWLAPVFNHVNVGFVRVMTGWTGLMARIPHGDMEVTRPAVWVVVLMYAVLVVAAWWRAETYRGNGVTE